MSEIFSSKLLLMLMLCLAISAIGYYRLVYFISVGYGYSIAGMGIGAMIIYKGISIPFYIQCTLLALYGIRLGTYLVYRDFRKSYKKELKVIKEQDKNTSFIKKVLIWVGVSILYVLMFTPAYARGVFESIGINDTLPIIAYIGCLLMLVGIVIESLADLQKSKFKKDHPNDYCSIGLYKFVRCPNYFGEVLFWTGNIITGILVLKHFTLIIGALIGYICIILIMIGSTKRLEFKQDDRYGGNEEYQKYRNETPVLFPFLPIYTLKNIKVYLE